MNDYGLLSLLPPVLTVVLAMWTRNIIVSLSMGVFSGSLILTGFNPFYATLDLIEQRVFVQIASPSNIQIIFTMMAIGGFIKLLEVSGGAKAFAKGTTSVISSSRRAQFSTWVSGMAIFFTDSGNALIIGPLFRSIFRELKICKEKLAYILDSTAAPICILIPFIGWGAYIMGLIEQAYVDTGLTETSLSVLLNVLPYQFYAILTLTAVPFFIFSGRDFGPMKKAQEQYNPVELSETDADAAEVEAPPLSLFVVPLVILLGTIALLLSWFAINDDLTSTHVRSTLTIAYMAASMACAMLMYKHQETSLNDSLATFIEGTQSMVFVVMILILAWSLSSVIKDLGTALTISQLIGEGLNPSILPALVFILGAIISLATGSSWGTFAILMALAVPVAFNIGAPLYLTVAAVLSGGLFGDHTSPISDTTVLASIGADCAHIDHVSTQFYYAMVPGSIAFLAFLLAGFYPTPWITLPAIIVLFFAIQIIGRKFGSSSVYNEPGSIRTSPTV
jgi:Na+/H+ antiporter NhaC